MQYIFSLFATIAGMGSRGEAPALGEPPKLINAKHLSTSLGGLIMLTHYEARRMTETRKENEYADYSNSALEQRRDSEKTQ